MQARGNHKAQEQGHAGQQSTTQHSTAPLHGGQQGTTRHRTRTCKPAVPHSTGPETWSPAVHQIAQDKYMLANRAPHGTGSGHAGQQDTTSHRSRAKRANRVPQGSGPGTRRPAEHNIAQHWDMEATRASHCTAPRHSGKQGTTLHSTKTRRSAGQLTAKDQDMQASRAPNSIGPGHEGQQGTIQHRTRT